MSLGGEKERSHFRRQAAAQAKGQEGGASQPWENRASNRDTDRFTKGAQTPAKRLESGNGGQEGLESAVLGGEGAAFVHHVLIPLSQVPGTPAQDILRDEAFPIQGPRLSRLVGPS